MTRPTGTVPRVGGWVADRETGEILGKVLRERPPLYLDVYEPGDGKWTFCTYRADRLVPCPPPERGGKANG